MKKLLAACTAALRALGLARGGNSAPRHAHKRVRITKPLAVFTTAILATGLAVVGISAPAIAHTGDLDVTAICNTQTGQYDLTATLTISQTGLNGSTKWKVGTSNFTGTPGSNQGLDLGPVSSTGAGTITLGTFSIPGTTTNKGPWVYAFTTWSDNFQKGSDGQLTTNLSGNCKTSTTVVTPADVTFAPAACTTPGNYGQGSYTIPTTAGVQYQIKSSGYNNWDDVTAGTKLVNVGTTVTIRAVDASSKDNYTLKSGTWEWTQKIAAPNTSCDVVTTPAVTFTDAVCAAGVSGATGTYVIKDVPGVQYQIWKQKQSNHKWEFVDVAPGTYTVPNGTDVKIKAIDASSRDGYTLADGNWNWEHTFAAAVSCTLGANPAVAVASECGFATVSLTNVVTLGAGQVGTPYTVTIFDGTTLLDTQTVQPNGQFTQTYRFAEDSGLHSLVVKAANGDVLKSVTNIASDCVVNTKPANPVVSVDAICGAATVALSNNYTDAPNTVGTSFDAAIYVDGVLDKVVTVPATTSHTTLIENYFFDEDSGVHTVVVKIGSTTVADAAVLSDCADNEVRIETDPYASSCTADLTDTELTSWIHVSLSDGVIYKIDGTVVTAAYTAATPNVAHHVTAEAAAGFTLVGTHAHEWTLTPVDTGVDCTGTLASLPSAASSTNQVCSAGVATGGSITVGQVAPGDNQFGNGVSYFIDGVKVTSVTTAVAPGTYHVTATVDDPQDTIDGDSAWTFTIAAPSAECPQLKTLAFTGADGSMGGMLIIALFLLLGGAGVYTASRVRSRES